LLFCAGWKGHFSLEDSCYAGAILHHLSEHFELNSDISTVTKDLFLKYENDLMAMIKKSAHFKRLNNFGVNRDFELCITKNLFEKAPFWNGSSIILG
jgi:2-phosphosulfolactate phosphatase